MQRIKIPFGGLNAEQMETLADLAEEYSDAICHVTTRQDFQLHFVHIDDTPDLMRRLAAVGITTLEACGNVVRNVTGCPLAGVCHDEGFDITPYAHALAYFLLGHKDTQDFGRKFKTAFSGCAQHACGLTTMHDLGSLPVHVLSTGELRRGFQFYVGGGLGAVPHQAQLLEAFVPEEELLPLAQAVCRVFARLGEKKNRARARLKFLVAKLGIEEFRRLVLEERAILPEDPRWTAYLNNLHGTDDQPTRAGGPLGPAPTLGFRPGSRPMSMRSGNLAMPWSPSASLWATSRPSRCARSRTSPGATTAGGRAPRWHRTSCCAGSARLISQRSTRTLSRQNWDRAGPRPWRISPPARGRIPVSWASPPPGGWQQNCASASSRAMVRSTPPSNP